MNYHKIVNQDSEWGALYRPIRSKSVNEGALKTVVFGSTNAGALVIEALELLGRKRPDKLCLTGVATDDPCDPLTRISVHRRIWKHYREEERNELMNRVIDLTTGYGVPCYTGSVKTEYFRGMLRQWNPDVIIMCCFGQKVDEYVFGYPCYGMYNFHPSELAARIGEGSQPFNETLNNGRKTSVMTVHIVTEVIDRGPIVGQSPKVNIRKADDSYPLSILSLQEKIPAICGWLAVELLQEIIRRHDTGIKGPVASIDFDRLTPDHIKQRLMEPANDDLSDHYLLPLHNAIK